MKYKFSPIIEIKRSINFKRMHFIIFKLVSKHRKIFKLMLSCYTIFDVCLHELVVGREEY